MLGTDLLKNEWPRLASARRDVDVNPQCGLSNRCIREARVFQGVHDPRGEDPGAFRDHQARPCKATWSECIVLCAPCRSARYRSSQRAPGFTFCVTIGPRN
jgi:hypothetical protein